MIASVGVASRRSILASAFASVFGCSDPTAPVKHIDVPLASVRIDDFYSVLHDSGLLVMSAVPVDSALRLEPDQRIAITVSLLSGDSESVDLARHLCPPQPHLCSSVSIGMINGNDVAILWPLLESLNARLRTRSTSGRFGAAWVLNPQELARVIDKIGDHPRVLAAEIDVVGGTSSSPSPNYGDLSGGLRLRRFTAPVPLNGFLEFQRPDTIVVAFRSASGAREVSKYALP